MNFEDHDTEQYVCGIKQTWMERELRGILFENKERPESEEVNSMADHINTVSDSIVASWENKLGGGSGIDRYQIKEAAMYVTMASDAISLLVELMSVLLDDVDGEAVHALAMETLDHEDMWCHMWPMVGRAHFAEIAALIRDAHKGTDGQGYVWRGALMLVVRHKLVNAIIDHTTSENKDVDRMLKTDCPAELMAICTDAVVHAIVAMTLCNKFNVDITFRKHTVSGAGVGTPS
jgi:hypothetical protein